MMKLKFPLTMSTCLLISCAAFERSPESGYSDASQKSSRSLKRSSKITQDQMPEKSTRSVSQKTKLRKLENSLSTRKEMEQYSKALPWFRSDEERADFLEQPGFESRQQWLSEKGFGSRANSVQSEMKDLVEAQDIALGMPQNLVRQSWGEPDTVEVSGNPQFKNERWRYNRYVSTQDGYKPEKKVVYFEGGKVVGWELE